MRAFVAVTFLLLCASLGTPSSLAQPPAFSVLIKGGFSFYGAVNIGFSFGGGGGGGGDRWKDGPIVGAGVEIQATQTLAFQGVVEYSRHHHKTQTYVTLTNDPVNTIVDVSANAKLSLGLVYLLGGLAVSREREDEMQWYNVWKGSWSDPGRTETYLSGTLGMGIQFKATDALGVFLEGSMRLRRYVTPVLEAGVSYRL